MTDIEEEIEQLSVYGITLAEARKIHEKQILGEAIVGEGAFSPIAELLWSKAISGYAAAIDVLTDVNLEVEKDKFYRAQRDARIFRDMLKWVNEAIRESKIAKATLDRIEEDKDIEERFDDNRQSSYSDD